jgi:hypothetical protein
MLQTLFHFTDSFQCYRQSSTLQIPSNATDTLPLYRFLPMLQTLLHDTDSLQYYRLSSILQIPSNATDSPPLYRFLPMLQNLSYNVPIPNNATEPLHCTNSFLCYRHSSTLQIPSYATDTLLLYRFLPMLQTLLHDTDSFQCYRLSFTIQIPSNATDTPFIVRIPSILSTVL